MLSPLTVLQVFDKYVGVETSFINETFFDGYSK